MHLGKVLQTVKAFPSYPLWLVIGLFFILISPAFLTDGMFIDGLYYATISKNLSEHFGTFWAPEFTATSTWGNGHPPLALFLQSLFFHFGSSIYIAKIYSVLTQIVCIIIMYGIWKELGMKRQHFWFVLLLWTLIPLMFWAATNNLLENTMAIFTLLSLLFYLKSKKSHRFIFLCCSGIMILLAFLTKGFTGLYPLAFPFIGWTVLRNTSFKNMLTDSLVTMFIFAMPLALLLTFSLQARSFFQDYFAVQVVNSIQNMQTVNSRFYIVFRYFVELIMPLVATGIACLVALKQKVFKESLSTSDKRTALVFLLWSLCGVLPIMISLKQSGFYILTVFPIAVIGLGIFAEPFLNNIRMPEKFQTVCKILSGLVLTVAISTNIFFAGKIGRDEKLLTDIHYLLPDIQEHTIVNIDNSLSKNHTARTYFFFLKKISLDPNQKHELLLSAGKQQPDNSYVLYKKAPNNLRLYRKRNDTTDFHHEMSD